MKIKWFNIEVKNLNNTLKDKLISKYLNKDTQKDFVKSTDVNVLLNRVRNNQKSESRKKIYFSAAASTGILIFGLLIF